MVGALDTTFRERWTARAPLNLLDPIGWIRDKVQGADVTPGPLPEQPPDPPPCGSHAVQVLRTYGDALFHYEFAKGGERSIARGYTKAVQRAERLIYVEDQYLWSEEVAKLFVDALTANPQLHLVAVVPRFFDLEGGLGGLRLWLAGTSQSTRAGVPAPGGYMCSTSKTMRAHRCSCIPRCVLDDVWACIGSDNFNRRSWTHDSELSCAVVDADGEFARDLRLRLLREHLDRAADGSEDGGLVDLAAAVGEIVASAEALDAWHESGCKGPRPPGRLRVHKAERIHPLSRLWAEPTYRLLYDPDGRSYRDRLMRRL